MDVNSISEDSSVGYILKVDRGNKSKHAVHYRNLQLHFSLEMKLMKVHKILELKQSDGLKRYIDLNADKREKAANSFRKDFFKVIFNSAYGETIKNLRKRINVRLVNNVKDYKNM